MSDANQPRTVSQSAKNNGFDISSLVLTAILVAAGIILNITLGNALAVTGIKPQFVIASYCLAVLLIRPKTSQAVVLGLISAAIIQVSTSIPGLNFLTESAGALVMAAIVNGTSGEGRVVPLVGAFCATLVSGLLFAACGTLIMGADIATVVVKLPIVLGTAVFNAIVVQALYLPLKKALKR